MDLEALRLFLDVARLGSFAAAARLRGVEPSSISRAIASLEGALGARLFHRSTRAMALTEAGELLLARAPTLTAEGERIAEDIHAAKREPVGVVRLTASVAYGAHMLAPLLPAFRARFPRLRLELVLTDATLDLVSERIDLALRLGPAARGDLEAIPLAPTRYQVVASPGYLAREGLLGQPNDLAQRDCLVFALPEFRARWRFRDAAGAEEVVGIRSNLVVSNALVLRQAALAGLGPALLANWLIAGDLSTGALVDLLPAHRATATTFDTGVWLLYPSRDFIPRRVRSVIGFLQEQLSATP